MNVHLRRLTFCAVIAALYAALTIALAPISYGPVQFRISEVLCILPFFIPCSTWGLFVGCLLANILSPVGYLDLILGPLATLGCCLCSAAIGRRWNGREAGRPILSCLMPVIWNGVIIGAMLAFTAGDEEGAKLGLFALYGAEVAAGEAAVLFVLGLPLTYILPRIGFFRKMVVLLGKKPASPWVSRAGSAFSETTSPDKEN